jgi:hypothetical protein
VAEPVDDPTPEPAGIDLSPDLETRPVSEAPQAVEAQTAAEAPPAAEAAASIAESVLMDHPEPKLAREPKIA